ncbi:MAG: histidine phosphatase family protein [Gemmatimonadota bacterium]
MRVLLIRHGRSAHVTPAGALDRVGVTRWRAAYDAAGVAAGEQPPAEVAADVARAAVVAASDLPRALASAALLAPGRSVHTSPLFREEPLPLPALSRFRAPLTVWEVLLYLKWMVAILRARDATPEARERARRAAQWCREAVGAGSAEEGTVAIVTHGVFRRLLAQELLRDGWRPEPRRHGYAHWSVWGFRVGPGEGSP